MKLTDVVYSLEKLKKMCITFEDETGQQAIEFVIADLTARIDAEKSMMAEKVKILKKLGKGSREERRVMSLYK